MDKNNADKEKEVEDLQSSPTISSSTESETFETWTLVTPELPTDRGKISVQDAKVTEKRKSKNEFDHQSHQRQDHDDDQHIENIKKDDHHTDGEISDGISIISDSESGGRSSPQPAPRRLSPAKLHSPPKPSVSATDEENDSDNNDEMAKTIIHSSFEPLTPPNTPETNTAFLVQKAIADESMILHQNYERDNDSTDSETDRPLVQGFNFTYAFFLAVFVAILAMFGRMTGGPILDTRDLNSVYAKLNEILTKTSHIEAIIQDTMNGLDGRSFDQYSNMLMRMKELNEKFEANNLAMQDALYRLTKSQKYPAINPDKPNMRESAGEYNVEFGDVERPIKAEKPTKPNWSDKPKDKFRRANEAPTPQDKQRHSQEQHNKYIRNDQGKYKNDQGTSTSGEKGNKDMKQNMNYKKREQYHKYDQNGQTNGRKEQHENGKREAQHKNEYPGHENRHKNGYREKNSDEQFKENNYKRNSREQEDDDWMERRRRLREDARKGSDENGQKRRSDDGNWYLERGNSRQKARKFEKAENRS